jgi:dienelactone hydrolase
MSDQEVLETVGEEAFSILVQFYEYDRGVPLDARVHYQEENEAYIREKIAFRGVRGDRIPGYLGLPKADLPSYPCVLLSHGWGSSKETWWVEDTDQERLTKELLSSGFAVLTLDTEYHGERTFRNDYDAPLSIVTKNGGVNQYRELLVQSTLEYRRAIDYLTTRSEIDTTRIGILGYSLGGLITFILTGVDPRITVAVTCATLPVSDFYMNRIGLDKTATIRMAPVAPQNFAPAIKQTSFLMLNGKTDHWGTLEEVRSLYELIASPSKELVLFESGHVLSVDYIPKAIKWFVQYFK